MSNNFPKKSAKHDPVLETSRKLFAHVWADTPDQHDALTTEADAAQHRREQFSGRTPERTSQPHKHPGLQRAAGEIISDEVTEPPATHNADASDLERARARADALQEKQNASFAEWQAATEEVERLETEEGIGTYLDDEANDATVVDESEQPRELTAYEKMGGTMPEGWAS